MPRWIKQSTAVTLPVGPVAGVTTGGTAVAGLSALSPAYYWKNDSGATFLPKTLAHSWNGQYLCGFSTSHVDTLGLLRTQWYDDDLHLMMWEDFDVVPANIWDSKFSTDKLEIDVQQWYGAAIPGVNVTGVPFVDVGYLGGSAQTLADLIDFADNGYDPDGNHVSANIVSLSGDTAAADNLESQYDTTGLVGNNFPATQAQIASITNIGSAVSIAPSSYNLTTGTQSGGTYTDTAALDGAHHEHTGSTAMDLYYQFVIGSGVPASVLFTGYLNGNNDDLEVHGYDWVTPAWVQIGTLEGKVASSNEVDSYELTVNMVGSAENEGLVRVRFTDGAFTLSSATLAVDQLLLSFSRGVEGYDNGSIWIDTTLSNTNTVVGIDGTARNPVSTMAAANTLSASTNLNRFEVAPGSDITFGASQDDQIFNGHDWILALGNRSVSGSYITGAKISGTCTGANPPTFTDCTINATTMPPCEMRRCGLANTITAGSAGNFHFNACFSEVAGTGTPVFDFGSGLNASNANFRHYSGGIDIRYMGEGSGTYTMSLEGDGQLIVNANCSATSTIAIRGNFPVTGDSTAIAAITFSEESRYGLSRILSDSTAFQGGDVTTIESRIGYTIPGDNAAVNVNVAKVQGIGVSAPYGASNKAFFENSGSTSATVVSSIGGSVSANVVKMQGTGLSTPAGANFKTFYEAGGSVSALTQQDVGASASINVVNMTFEKTDVTFEDQG